MYRITRFFRWEFIFALFTSDVEPAKIVKYKLLYALSLDLACSYEICPFIVILNPFKRFPIQSGCFYGMLDVHLMDEMETILLRHVYTLYI